ncbi:MAG: DUF4863 family protein [Deltaproteobacteria bacterium]|nr:DUF4863 family protein [Deltaproteobacteria bacterium]
MGIQELLTALEPVFDALTGLDLSRPDEAREHLAAAFPTDGEVVGRLRALVEAGVAEGWLCDQEAGSARFSRVAKPGEATRGFSVDAVELSGPGVWHRHPAGEVNLCFAAGSDAVFDGFSEGWVVFGKGSEHVPTVSGGRMLLLYFLPGGRIDWKR